MGSAGLDDQHLVDAGDAHYLTRLAARVGPTDGRAERLGDRSGVGEVDVAAELDFVWAGRAASVGHGRVLLCGVCQEDEPRCLSPRNGFTATGVDSRNL
jgi:hypothetical protein